MIEPIKRNITIWQGSEYGFGLRLISTGIDGVKTLFDTTGYTARFTIRQGGYDGEIVFDANENDYLQVGYDPPELEFDTAYDVGARIVSGLGDGLIYECTTAGTTTDDPIVWDQMIGGTTAIGSAVFTCIATDRTQVNFRLSIPSSATEGMTDWGVGFYTLDLTDTWGNTQRLYHGAAYLSRRTTY